jgi:hypothetical protein
MAGLSENALLGAVLLAALLVSLQLAGAIAWPLWVVTSPILAAATLILLLVIAVAIWSRWFS